MDWNEFFNKIENEKMPIDFRKYVISLFSYHITNQNYLKAILEAQVELLVKIGNNPDIDADKHIKIIEDKIDQASDHDFIEAIQQIIRKD